jgi:hypothetical protein
LSGKENKRLQGQTDNKFTARLMAAYPKLPCIQIHKAARPPTTLVSPATLQPIPAVAVNEAAKVCPEVIPTKANPLTIPKPPIENPKETLHQIRQRPAIHEILLG